MLCSCCYDFQSKLWQASNLSAACNPVSIFEILLQFQQLTAVQHRQLQTQQLQGRQQQRQQQQGQQRQGRQRRVQSQQMFMPTMNFDQHVSGLVVRQRTHTPKLYCGARLHMLA